MKYLVILGFLFSMFGAEGQTYYTCSPSGAPNLDDQPDGSGSCAILPVDWDKAGVTVEVINGTTFNFDQATYGDVEFDLVVKSGGIVNLNTNNDPFALDGNITVESGGVLNIEQSAGHHVDINASITIDGALNANSNFAGGHIHFRINAGASMVVNGSLTGSDTPGTVKLEMKDKTSSLEINGTVDVSDEVKLKGDITIGTGGSLTTTDKLKVDDPSTTFENNGDVSADILEFKNGDVSGVGTFDYNTIVLTNGTINNVDVADITVSGTVLNLFDNGFKWENGQWYELSSGTWVLAGAATPGASDLVIINDDYATDPDGSLSSPFIAVLATRTLAFNSGDDLSSVQAIYIEGTVRLSNGIKLDTTTVLQNGGGGAFELERIFSRPGWHQMNWPLSASSTKALGDLATVGNITPSRSWVFNYDDPPGKHNNIWYWDATQSSWVVPNADTTLSGRAFGLYTFENNSRMLLNIDVEDLNIFDPVSQILSYDDPGADPPGFADDTWGLNGWVDAVTDGWNLWVNPFQANIDVAALLSVMPTAAGELDATVHVWNGTSYATTDNYIGPNQSFFVRTNGLTGTFPIPYSVANITESAPNYFKEDHKMRLKFSGEGQEYFTDITLSEEGTLGYDNGLDAYYIIPPKTSNAAILSSVSKDSIMYGHQVLPIDADQPVYLTFEYAQKQGTFRVELESSKSRNVMILEDILNGKFTDLSYQSYDFEYSSSSPAQRFKVHFSEESAREASKKYEEKPWAWFVGNALNVDAGFSLEGASIDVFSSDGKLCYSGMCGDEISISDKGVYVVRITTEEGVVHGVKAFK